MSYSGWKQSVIDRLNDQPGERLSPRTLEKIQTAVHENLGRFIDSTSYLVLGSYGDDERSTLEAVSVALTDVNREAFLMDDILDITEFFTSKFKRLLSYADHIVGIYEHSLGGHAWEAGHVDQPMYRTSTRVFYRIYETQAEQYASYDGMFAHWILSMDRVNRAHPWTHPDDLLDCVVSTYRE